MCSVSLVWQDKMELHEMLQQYYYNVITTQKTIKYFNVAKLHFDSNVIIFCYCYFV